MIAELEQAAKDAKARIDEIAKRKNVGAVVERAQLESARKEIFEVIAELWRRVGDLTRAAQAEAASLAIDVGWQWDQVLLTRAIPSAATRRAMRDSLNSAASRNVEGAIQRMGGNRVALSRRVYLAEQLVNGQVDRRINSALARGINWRQFATEVKDLIRPDTPGGVSYAAKRLARTEINAAYHALSVQQNVDKPWNQSMDWNTSKSHPKEDICDLLAKRGPYPMDDVPRKPHPQCLCYVSPRTVTPEVFLQEYRRGAYDDYIRRTYGYPGSQAA